MESRWNLLDGTQKFKSYLGCPETNFVFWDFEISDRWGRGGTPKIKFA